MDGVGTPIIGRPRPLPGHDTPNPAYHPHTLNYEEPVKGADQVSHRPLMQFLSRTMPLGVMVVLVAYTLGDLSADLGRSAALVGAVAITTGLHLWRGNVALSLIVGTASYALLAALAV